MYDKLNKYCSSSESVSAASPSKYAAIFGLKLEDNFETSKNINKGLSLFCFTKILEFLEKNKYFFKFSECHDLLKYFLEKFLND
jgi:hypothetical protein